MCIFFGLIFFLLGPLFGNTQKNFPALQIFPSINTLTTLNCTNTLAIYNGILSVSNSILFQGNTFTIGNQNTPTQLFIPYLPTNQNQNQFLPCMLSVGSNIVYLGDPSSPLPAPDFTSIPSLETNDLLMYPAPNPELHSQINFNSLQPGDIFLGNNNITLNVMSPGSINFNTVSSQKKLRTIISPYSIIFSCPVVEIYSIISDSILTANTLSFNNEITTVQGEVINFSFATEINTYTTTFGKMDLTSSININGATLNCPNIILGSQSKPITKIINIPLVDYINGPPYIVLSQKDNTTLYHTPSVRMPEETKKTYLKNNTLTIDAINTNSKENIFFNSPVITIGKLNIKNTLEINANNVVGNIHFSNCTFSEDTLIIMKKKGIIKNREEKKLTIESLDTDEILILSSIMIPTKDQNNNVARSDFLAIDNTGKVKKIIPQNENEYEELSRLIEKLKLDRKRIKIINKDTEKKIKQVEKKISINKNILKKILFSLRKRKQNHD
jgi:hypothetical protein